MNSTEVDELQQKNAVITACVHSIQRSKLRILAEMKVAELAKTCQNESTLSASYVNAAKIAYSVYTELHTIKTEYVQISKAVLENMKAGVKESIQEADKLEIPRPALKKALEKIKVAIEKTIQRAEKIVDKK